MRRDLHDRGKQGERATPCSAQSHTVVHYLANEVLHTPTVVLHRLVEPLFLEGQVPALPFCDDLPLPDVSLVPKTILSWLDPRLQEAGPSASRLKSGGLAHCLALGEGCG